MNLELKSIKHSAFASQETHCYEAAIYLDGEPFALTSNDGGGGCDRGAKHPKCKLTIEEYRAKHKEIEAYFKTLPTERVQWGDDPDEAVDIQPTSEGWCHDQVTLFLTAKDLKRMLKNKVVLHETATGKTGTLNRKYSPVDLPAIKGKFPGHTILNSLDFEAALKLFTSK